MKRFLLASNQLAYLGGEIKELWTVSPPPAGPGVGRLGRAPRGTHPAHTGKRNAHSIQPRSSRTAGKLSWPEGRSLEHVKKFFF